MSLKSYRFLGEEAEVLGSRLDAARKAHSNAKSAWAKLYWKQATEQLLFQWRQLPILHDADAQVTIIPRWTVNYDFYEEHQGIGHDFTDRIFDNIFREPDLTGSWERERERRLAKAQ